MQARQGPYQDCCAGSERIDDEDTVLGEFLGIDWVTAQTHPSRGESRNGRLMWMTVADLPAESVR